MMSRAVDRLPIQHHVIRGILGSLMLGLCGAMFAYARRVEAYGRLVDGMRDLCEAVRDSVLPW
jgi:hypothetical protein